MIFATDSHDVVIFSERVLFVLNVLSGVLSNGNDCTRIHRTCSLFARSVKWPDASLLFLGEEKMD